MSNQHWPLVPLGDVLTRNDKLVTLLPDQQYREITIRLWGERSCPSANHQGF